MAEIIRPSHFADVSSLIGQGEICAFNVGADEVVYLVIAAEPLNYYIEEEYGSFPRTEAERPQQYRVIGLNDSGIVLDIDIRDEPYNIHRVEVLPDALLLACARSFRYPDGTFDYNGRVYSRDGHFQRGILLGDDISVMQATRTGTIWAGYGDEGVYGNYGWTERLGRSGLVAWDSLGNQQYEFKPLACMDSIVDCDALNVVSEDEVWISYYSAMKYLVQIQGRAVRSVWYPEFHGIVEAIAVSDGHVLILEQGNDNSWLSLHSLQADRQSVVIARLALEDASGVSLHVKQSVGRGNEIYFLSDHALYRIDLETALSACGKRK